jgi:hypothetical protein
LLQQLQSLGLTVPEVLSQLGIKQQEDGKIVLASEKVVEVTTNGTSDAKKDGVS